MKKAKNGKSILIGTCREGLSEAESNPMEGKKKVHPGADFVRNRNVFSRIRIYPLCSEVREQNLFSK